MMIFFCVFTDCCQGSLDKPPLAQWLYYSWYFPRPLQIHFGVPRVLQGVCNVWSVLLPHTAATHEEGPYYGGISGAVRPSVQTHTGEVALSTRVFTSGLEQSTVALLVWYLLVVGLLILDHNIFFFPFCLAVSSGGSKAGCSDRPV